MGWAPDVAMNADPIMIRLAWKGHCEEIETWERIMFAAGGNPLPPKGPPRLGPGSAASRLRAFAMEHNSRRKRLPPAKKVK